MEKLSPEIKLVRAIEDTPKILDRFTREKGKYVTFIRAALLKHAQKDNLVYHGLFGNFFLQDVPHVLKVRIVGDLETRVADEVERAGISAAKAREILLRDDEERRKWALHSRIRASTGPGGIACSAAGRWKFSSAP